MEDPSHLRENRFWDLVSGWLLREHDRADSALPDEEFDALLRQMPNGEPPANG